MPTICSGVYFENDVLVFPNGYAVRNKLRQIWLINQIKVVYGTQKKRNRVELQFCFTRFFRKLRLDKTNIYDSDLLDNVKRTDFYENIGLWCLV